MNENGKDPVKDEPGQAGKLPDIEESPGLIADFLYFLRYEWKWWLLPIVFVLIALGVFLLFAQSSPLAPLIYPLF